MEVMKSSPLLFLSLSLLYSPLFPFYLLFLKCLSLFPHSFNLDLSVSLVEKEIIPLLNYYLDTFSVHKIPLPISFQFYEGIYYAHTQK